MVQAIRVLDTLKKSGHRNHYFLQIDTENSLYALDVNTQRAYVADLLFQT